MRWTVAVRALAMALAFATLPTTRASASSFQVDIGFFYNDLAPHGRWIENVQYGRVWVPSVSASWRPYAEGHWVWTDDYGWLWVSDEDFGWAVYHYGRWYEDPVYGWAWVPGYEWAPAWVSFREGGGYMGWAPLPPRVAWAGGFSVGAVQFDAFIEPRHYCFVPERDFVDGSIRGRIVPVARNVTIVHATENVTRFGVESGRIVNRSVSVERVEHAVGRPVPRLRTVAVESPAGSRRERVRGNTVQLFNPAVRRATVAAPPGRSIENQARPRDHASARPEARSSHTWQEQPRGRETQDRTQRQEAARLEQARREETQARQRDISRQRQADEKRQARQLADDNHYRQQLEKRQVQENKEMERVHQREIKHQQQAASAKEMEQRRQAEHQALEQRHNQQRQDFEASRQQAHQAQSRRQDQPRAEARPSQPREQNHPKEKAKPRSKESQHPS